MSYATIAEDTRNRILTETRAKIAARRAFLESLVADADANMAALDQERLGHFLAKHMAAAELRDMDANLTDL